MRKNKLLLLLALLLTAATGAWAEEQVVYTLDGTQTASNYAYATAGLVEQGGITWRVTGNVNQNPWRIGGRNLSGVDRPVWSENALDGTVTKVTLEFGTANSITVNSITMTVASDDDFSDVIDTKAVDFSANNTVDVTPTEGKEWKNAYYRFVFNVTVSASSNKFLQLKSIKFYNDPDAQQQGGSTEPVAGTFTVTMKDGTVDAKNWSIASGEKSAKGDAADGLTGLSEKDAVTLQYTGRLKVKGVKATSDAAAAKVPANTPDIAQANCTFSPSNGKSTLSNANITTSMEYSTDGGTTWTDVTSNGSIASLAAGTVQIRVKETVDNLASEAVSITVPEVLHINELVGPYTGDRLTCEYYAGETWQALVDRYDLLKFTTVGRLSAVMGLSITNTAPLFRSLIL